MHGLREVFTMGREHRALQGMRALLDSRAVGAIFTEVSLPHLQRAHCSKDGLLRLLQGSNYRVDRPNGPPGFWSWDILAVGKWDGAIGSGSTLVSAHEVVKPMVKP